MTFKRSSESIIFFNNKTKIVTKTRLKKQYLLKADRLKLAKSLTTHQYKMLLALNKLNFNCPTVYNKTDFSIKMEYLNSQVLPLDLSSVGFLIAELHKNNIIHNDLNLNNFIFCNNKFYLIDFSLSYFSHKICDKISDIYLLITDLKNHKLDCASVIESYKDSVLFDFDLALSTYLRLRRYNSSNST